MEIVFMHSISNAKSDFEIKSVVLGITQSLITERASNLSRV